MSRLRRSNKAEQTRRGGRARAFRLLPGIYDAQRLRAGLKYVAPPALERGRTDTARREGTGVPAAARNLRCRGWSILAGFAPPPHPAAVAGWGGWGLFPALF